MIDCKKAFIDTAPFIYYVEESPDNPCFYDKIRAFFEYSYNNYVDIVSSVITIEEYCVMPYREHEEQRINLFQKLIETLEVDIISVDENVAHKAAQIRANNKSFKSMDSIQLAVACLNGCDLFLTNDKQLKQFKEIDVITIDELY